MTCTATGLESVTNILLGDGGVRLGGIVVHVNHRHILGPRAIA
jgi:hypothetical protein